LDYTIERLVWRMTVMKKPVLSRRDFLRLSGAFTASLAVNGCSSRSLFVAQNPSRPNIVLIYADDVGYGDLACYGARGVATPNVDRLAEEGLRFTSAYASSATCTPSRYSMLTGQYAWRKPGTGILAGDAGMIIDSDRLTLPGMLKRVGYTTGVVGKWHLGLGDGKDKIDWNKDIKPGPLEIGFDYAFLMPATGDRVPCVYMENRRVVNLDPADPIKVSYKEPFPGQPTGVSHRDRLKMDWTHGHNNSIVNGIGRIGFMTGGTAALWKDEDMADTFVGKAVSFIESSRQRPFFLYFSTHDIHVPRVPHPRFEGKTDMGPRGDAIAQFDWSVGQILDEIEKQGLADNTIIIVTSDNGPVLDDGYKDQAVERLGGHKPAGPLRGGKYSAFDAGTRIPFIVRWPKRTKTGVSDALVSQVDLIASFASLTGQPLAADQAPDSLDIMAAIIGDSKTGREHIIEHSISGALSVVMGGYKYIEPNNGPKIDKNTNIELGNSSRPQLYDLRKDTGETDNLADKKQDIVREMDDLLRKIKTSGRTRRL